MSCPVVVNYELSIYDVVTYGADVSTYSSTNANKKRFNIMTNEPESRDIREGGGSVMIFCALKPVSQHAHHRPTQDGITTATKTGARETNPACRRALVTMGSARGDEPGALKSSPAHSKPFRWAWSTQVYEFSR